MSRFVPGVLGAGVSGLGAGGVHGIAHGFDDLIKARVEDMATYRAFLGETLVNLPGARETRTYAVLEEVKNTVVPPV